MAEPQQLRVGSETYSIYRLDALQAQWDVARLPYTLRILLENVLRNGTYAEVEAVAGWGGRGGAGEGGGGGGRAGRAVARDLVRARARAAPGLHRRALCRRPRGNARRD